MMEKKQWAMQEDFTFLADTGVPVGAEMVKVTPIFTEERTEDAVRLTGIYHIAANVVFGEGEISEELSDSAILIDDVELEGLMGYFEYAVPLRIDLPPEVESPLQVVATEPTSEWDGQGSFSVVWNVECSYNEALALVEEPVAVAVEIVEIVEIEEVVAVAAAPAPVTAFVATPVAPAPVAASIATPIAIHDSTSFSEADEALSFIAGLADGISTTTYSSNDVFVKNES